MIKFNVLVWLIISTINVTLAAKHLDFIDSNFDDFIQRVVQEKEKNEFKSYYAMLSQKMDAADAAKRRTTLRYLYDLALNRLQEKHFEWADEIKPLVSDAKFVLDEQLDNDRKIIRFFLVRYGAYEEFLNVKNLVHDKPETQSQLIAIHENKGIWTTLKSYFNAATDTINNWFGKKEIFT